MSSIKKSIRFSESLQKILDERDKNLYPTESSFIEDAVKNFNYNNLLNSDELKKTLKENLEISKQILDKISQDNVDYFDGIDEDFS